MNHEEYIKYHQKCCQMLIDITRKKNADYSGGAKDAFGNFKMTAEFGVASVEQGFFTRMTDKMSRVASFIKNGELKVKDEGVEDTLLDLANYCILFSGYLKSQKPKEKRQGHCEEPPRYSDQQITDMTENEFNQVFGNLNVGPITAGQLMNRRNHASALRAKFGDRIY